MDRYDIFHVDPEILGGRPEFTGTRVPGVPLARNISTATLTPFLPEPGKANGAAVIVAPGGSFRWLSMGSEGWEVAEVLAERGIAAFVLEYRLQPTPESLDGFGDSMTQTFTAASEPSDAPPMLHVIAADDCLFRGQFGVIQSWFEAGRPVEFPSTRTAATVSASEIRTAPAMAGSVPFCTG